MTVYRRGKHRSQYDGSPLASQNCTPTSAANGAREATDGAYDHSGGFVRGLVKSSEETSPSTPGWSLVDADLAMSRAGVPFSIGAGGWDGVVAAHNSGRGLILQGDSDVFADTTCSGAFNGNHAVYVHPEENAVGEWLLGDPICGNWRWERPGKLKQYAEKFSATIKYGVFTTPVRKLAVDEEEPPMAQKPITSTTPAIFDIPVGAKSYQPDGTGPDVVYDKPYANRFSPYAVGTWRAFYASRDGKTVIRLLAGATNVRPVPAPADNTPYAQADVDKARAEGFVAGAASIVAKIKSALGL